MTICPICESAGLIKSTRERRIPLEFGRDVFIDETIWSCPECGMEGDFFNENDQKIEAAIVESDKKVAAMIIDDLSMLNISMAYIERAMGLPARTLARWKRGEVTASASALLKTVRTYPWILDVAERRFDHNYAMDRLAYEGTKAAINKFSEKVRQGEIDASCKISTDSKSTTNINITLSSLFNIEKTHQETIEVLK